MCIPTTDICTKYILFCIPDMYMPGINAKMYRRLFRVYYGCCVLNVSYLENFVSVIQSVTGWVYRVDGVFHFTLIREKTHIFVHAIQ